MSLYTQEELEVKSYESLYEIALSEKLINIYSRSKTRKELIDIILLYRKNNYAKKILNKDLESFILLQSLLDTKLRESQKKIEDIRGPRKLVIYENLKFNELDNYYFLFSKSINFNNVLVLLVGKNNYIYSIINLELDEKYMDKNYVKYIFSSENINRFEGEYSKNEKMNFLFFFNYEAEIIYEIYTKKSTKILPESIRAYSLKLFEFEFKKVYDTISYCPVIFYRNKIATNYFEKEFAMYIRLIDKDNIYIDFFDKAKDTIKLKEYDFYGTYFDDLNEIIEAKESIIVYDDFLNSKLVNKELLLNLFFNELKEEINSYSKKRFNKYYSIGLDIEYENFEYIPITILLNYNLTKKNLSNRKNRQYLIICEEYGDIKVSENNFKMIEKDINYDVDINCLVKLSNRLLSYHSIINKIIRIIEDKIENKKFIDYTAKEIMNLIDNGEYNNIIKQLENEKIKYETNEEYMKDKKKYNILKRKSIEILDMYLDKNFEFYEYGHSRILKSELDLIFTADIYNFLNNFFSRYTSLELLSKYVGINLSGDLIKSELFYNILKEYIPGKLIVFDDNRKNSLETLICISNNYIEDLHKGKIHFKIDYNLENQKYRVYVKDFKDEYKLVIDTRKDKVAYIDKIISAKTLEYKIENLDDKDIKNYEIEIPDFFIETDEEFIDFDQKILDDVENDIIRCFFYYNEKSNKLSAKFAKRYEDQLYITGDIAVIVDSYKG